MNTTKTKQTGYQKLAQKSLGLNVEGIPGGAGTRTDPIRYDKAKPTTEEILLKLIKLITGR